MTNDTLNEPTTEYGADALIVCDNLVRIYQVENIEVQALQGLDLLVDKGEMIAIVGQSGSGKSTLLNVLSGLDVPTAGAARVAGWDLLRMAHADRLTYRRSVVGFVWQQTGRNLLSYLNAKENVMLPMAFAGVSGKQRADRAMELLGAMGMADKAGRRPNQLSGGEQQRVAIAVALANSPEVIFADEPTGELDSATGDDVFEALRSANRDLGATVVVVTHDHAVSSQVQRTVAIRTAAPPPRWCAAPTSTPRASRRPSTTNTPCSTARDACNCRATTAPHSASRTACASNWNTTTSAYGPTAPSRRCDTSLPPWLPRVR